MLIDCSPARQQVKVEVTFDLTERARVPSVGEVINSATLTVRVLSPTLIKEIALGDDYPRLNGPRYASLECW
jgi:hypothetical protein